MDCSRPFNGKTGSFIVSTVMMALLQSSCCIEATQVGETRSCSAAGSSAPDEDDSMACFQNKLHVSPAALDHDEKSENADHTTANASRIPHLVFFTGPISPDKVVENNRAYVPSGTEFRYYNDEHMNASAWKISQHLAKTTGIHGAYEAFANLRPFAFRADLWRAMVVWEHGGLYLDAKLVMTSLLSSWLSPTESSLNLCYDNFGKFYNNQVIAAPPRDKKLEVIIRHIVKNIKTHSYGMDSSMPCLDITGPVAYTTALKEAGMEANASCITDHEQGTKNGWEYDGIHRTNPGRDLVVIVNSADVHNKMHSGTGYDQYCNERQVYCDEVSPTAGACGSVRTPCKLGALQLEKHNGDSYWSKTV